MFTGRGRSPRRKNKLNKIFRTESHRADFDRRTRECSQQQGSSERVDGLFWAYPADVSRYARTESHVFDLLGANPSRHASLTSGIEKSVRS